jgi:hypothetical protein
MDPQQPRMFRSSSTRPLPMTERLIFCTEPPQRCKVGTNWHSLPTELELRILQYRLIIANPLSNLTHPSHSKRALLPLLLTWKSIYPVAMGIYYNKGVQIGHLRNVSLPWQEQLARAQIYPHLSARVFLRRIHSRMNISIASITCLTEDFH